jgi:hypothetical protein
MHSTNTGLDLTQPLLPAAGTNHLHPRARFEAPAELHNRLAPPVANAFNCARLVRSLRVRVVLS